MRCSKCNSENIKNNGIRYYGVNKVTKYSCNECDNSFTVPYKDIDKIDNSKQNLVVTSAISGVGIHDWFLECLLNYCKVNNAKLVVLPVSNGKPFDKSSFPDEIQEYMLFDNASFNDVVLMGAIKLNANLESPLHGIAPFSKGKNIVLGHPQVQLRTLPRKSEKYPAIITTTGTVSLQKYGDNKTALKANFNHSFSALFIDKKRTGMIRHLNYDGVGFYDLDSYYFDYKVKKVDRIEAIVTGDEHVMFYDNSVLEATYGKNGIVNKLNPKYIIRHDVLDCYSISHHHKNNTFTRYAKHIGNINSIEDELKKTLEFITNTTPKDAKSVIISSNHNNHLLRWLNEVDIKNDMVNIKIYHQLMFLMLSSVKLENGIPSYADPFTLWASDKCDPKKVEFLSSSDTLQIKDIDVNIHGDLGTNGTRGSIVQYRDLPSKSIIGHSHAPGIEKGAYQVGTSTKLRLDYNSGLSNWHHCHCLIYPNGKRQLIFILDGEWR